MAIKSKSKAEPKFYYLLILRDMLLQKQGQALPNPHVISYFQKKMGERLFKITYNKGHQITEKYKEECLAQYLIKHQSASQMKQDLLYQKRFFILLKEIWMQLKMQQRDQEGLKGYIQKLLPIIQTKEHESYINYPDDYDESFEENQTLEKNNVEQINEKLTQPLQKPPKNVQPKREQSFREEEISKKLFDFHNAILNMSELIQEDVDDIIISALLEELQSMENASPPIKEVLL